MNSYSVNTHHFPPYHCPHFVNLLSVLSSQSAWRQTPAATDLHKPQMQHHATHYTLTSIHHYYNLFLLLLLLLLGSYVHTHCALYYPLINLNDTNICIKHPILPLIQGNILSGHGKEHQLILFLQWTHRSTAKSWLKHIGALVTSAKRQQQQREQQSPQQRVFLNVFLTASGYRFLALASVPADKRFQMGAAAVAASLFDPSQTTWEAPYQQDIHAALLIADDSKTVLDKYVNKILYKQILQHNIVLISSEWGQVRQRAGLTVEPFGFADGISQPRFWQAPALSSSSTSSSTTSTSPSPLSLVLVGDNYGGYGSYAVYRKLEQDVTGFHHRLHQLAAHLSAPIELAGAYIIGRFTDGTPVVLSARPASRPTTSASNDFDYSNDVDGYKCPLHAHIRKANPRGDTTRLPVRHSSQHHTTEQEQGHRIVRRAIPYKQYTAEDNDNSSSTTRSRVKEGLLFVCLQANIEDQFEFIQSRWFNHEDFVVKAAGVDPLVGKCAMPGATSSASEHGQSLWPKQWGNASAGRHAAFSFADFVTLRGAVYMYLPSIAFLHQQH